jgi:hypothetical protein
MFRRKLKNDNPRERDVQNKLRTDLYKKYGMIRYENGKYVGNIFILKLTMLGMYGTAGIMDLAIFVRKKEGGAAIFIEMKREGEESTDNQIQRQNEFRALGFSVHCCDNLPLAKRIAEQEIDKILYGKKRTNKRLTPDGIRW